MSLLVLWGYWKGFYRRNDHPDENTKLECPSVCVVNWQRFGVAFDWEILNISAKPVALVDPNPILSEYAFGFLFLATDQGS